MFAIDGVKLPSNASKAKSGKRKDFMRQAQKMEQAVEKILGRHRANDLCAVEASLSEREQRQVERLKREAQQINEWLQQHPQSARAPKATRGSPIALTTSRRTCPRTKAWCKAIPAWPRSMRST